MTDIVGGTVRWRRYLDHLIMSVCIEERMFRDMEPLLLQVSFYELATIVRNKTSFFFGLVLPVKIDKL